MKTSLYKSVIVSLFMGVALTSCSDFLDADNKSAGGQTADDYLGSDPQALLTSAYESMKDIVFSPELYCISIHVDMTAVTSTNITLPLTIQLLPATIPMYTK